MADKDTRVARNEGWDRFSTFYAFKRWKGIGLICAGKNRDLIGGMFCALSVPKGTGPLLRHLWRQ